MIYDKNFNLIYKTKLYAFVRIVLIFLKGCFWNLGTDNFYLEKLTSYFYKMLNHHILFGFLSKYLFDDTT